MGEIEKLFGDIHKSVIAIKDEKLPALDEEMNATSEELKSIDNSIKVLITGDQVTRQKIQDITEHLQKKGIINKLKNEEGDS